MENLKKRIAEFLEDYNALLNGLNDELSGIEDMGLNKKAKSLKDVKLADLECDEYLDNEYHEIKNHISINDLKKRSNDLITLLSTTSNEHFEIIESAVKTLKK